MTFFSSFWMNYNISFLLSFWFHKDIHNIHFSIVSVECYWIWAIFVLIIVFGFYIYSMCVSFHRVMGSGETPILIVGNKRDLQRGRVIPRHSVSDLVRKSWKCGYVECSAKFNWHILLLFGEALRSVGCARCKHIHATIRFQRALRRERCVLMWGRRFSSTEPFLKWFMATDTPLFCG